jgi:hypothetical protein
MTTQPTWFCPVEPVQVPVGLVQVQVRVLVGLVQVPVHVPALVPLPGPVTMKTS